MPSPLGRGLYRQIQKRFGAFRNVGPWDHFLNAAEMAIAVQEAVGAMPPGPLIEIGVGARPMLLLGFWLMGISGLTAVDRVRSLDLQLLQRDLEAMRRDPGRVQAILREPASDGFADRLRWLLDPSLSAPRVLDGIGFDYRAPVDARVLPVTDSTCGLHVSRSVLEHVEPDAIAAVLGEARRALRRGGLLAHLIDFSDHFAHEDTTIPLIHFLKFSPEEWQRLAGNAFAYHNRMRSSDWERHFEAHGLRILFERRLTDQRSLEFLDAGFEVHQDFRGYPPAVLACRRALYVLGLGS